MNRFHYLFVLLAFLLTTVVSAQTLPRAAEIKDPSALERGFGAIIAGVDFDGDGLPEIYACNTNMVDGPYEVIPRLYKFEWNPTTATWDSVWGTVAPVELQNTWPALTYGDVDKDGKPEIYWGPVNNIGSDLNPARILVYEYSGSGDAMGVDDGFGGWLPNAKTSIVTSDSYNLRPIKMVVADVDGDGTDEIIFSDRAGTWHVGVLSVDDIPDNGGGLETWTTEFTGDGDLNLADAGAAYDLVVVDNTIGLIAGNGKVALIQYKDGAYVSTPLQSGVAEENSSFKGSVVVDLLNDGGTDVFVGSWYSGKVYLITKPDNADTLVSYEVADFSPYATRLNGAGVGDIDADGLPDMIFGSRYVSTNTAKVPICRLEYQGGDKTSPSSYIASIVDSAYWTNNGDMDVICVANIDGDPEDEILYTQGYSRGNPTDAPMPIVVLDPQVTPLSVERENSQLPDNFYVNQNYPNPFNPSTTIKFGINQASNVDLRVYDILGREVAVLVNNEFMGAGKYNVKFDSKSLASGTYIYRIIAGNNTVSKKMQLLK